MYTKIFRQIYEGTLCTKGPWQALVTFQQFLILADKFGVVDMTAEAIARITTVPIDVINIGISALEQEDSGSRNSNLNGRRIARLRDHTTWGWQIVNYEAFAKIRSAEERREYQREYKREYREKDRQSTSVNKSKQRSENVTMSTPHTHTHTHKTLLPDKSGDVPGFVEFWASYPRKESKAKAMAAWRKLRPDESLRSAISAGLATAKASEQWQKDGGKFIPHPTTWINGRRWEDIIPTKQELGYDPAILAALRKQHGDRVRPSDNGYFYDPVLQVRFDPNGEKLLAI
jgi:hypothetical protein